MAFRFKVQVNASPEEAFAYVADLTRHGEWANSNATLEVESVSGGLTSEGSKFRSTQKFLGKPQSADIVVTEFDPPARLSFDAIHPGKKGATQTYNHTFTFRRAGEGTEVERAIDGASLRGPGVLLYPAIRGDAMKALRNLKAKFAAR